MGAGRGGGGLTLGGVLDCVEYWDESRGGGVGLCRGRGLEGGWVGVGWVGAGSGQGGWRGEVWRRWGDRRNIFAVR